MGDEPSSTNCAPGWRPSVLAVILLLICLGLNIWHAQALEIHRTVPLWVMQAIPVAIANDRFHYPLDYTGCRGVEALFSRFATNNSAETVDRAIAEMVARRRLPIDRSPYLVSYDDKGIIDFVRLAFYLFGYRTQSGIWLYWFLLALSCTLFCFRHGSQHWALAILFTFLLAHYCVLPVIAINPQLTSMLALRFMSVLGIVAALHLSLDVWFPPRAALSFLAMVAQVAIVTFTLHIRFSSVWEVLLVGAAFVLLVASRLRALWHEPNARRLLVVGFVPVGLVVAATMSLQWYKKAVYAEDYYVNGGSSHVFWHSVYSGLAYSPALAQEYSLLIDDVSVTVAAKRYLYSHGRGAEWEAIGNSNDQYDQVVKEMFFDTCRERFSDVVLCTVYYKPLALGQYIAWFLRLSDAPPCLEILWPSAEFELKGMARKMDNDGKALRLIRWECILPLLFFAFWAREPIRSHLGPLIAVFALLFLCSLMPSLLGYPTAHTISDALIVFSMSVYLGLTLIVGCLASTILRPVAYFRSALSCK